MAFHVPFSQRHRRPPIYIGFDTPTFVKRRFNWWGFNGLWMSFLGLLTAGVMSPLALLVSLVGLRRRPRKMAIAGTFVSLAGVAMLTTILVVGISDEMDRQKRIEQSYRNQVVAKQIDAARTQMQTAATEFEQYRDEHDGVLPEDLDGNMLAIKNIDPWGESLRFDVERDHALLRSAGPDKKFNSADDLTLRIEGKTDIPALLPVD